LRWRKLGLLFDPAVHRAPWFVSHAALPVVQARGDRHRVYFSGRDDRGRAHVGWFEADLHEGRVLAVSPEPVLSPGALGAFDDSGVTSSCLVEQGGRLWLHYTGWSLGVTVPFYLFAGVAVSDDGGDSFRRLSGAPLLERSAVDPLLTASAWIERDGDRWHMWYVSASGWRMHEGKPRHDYHVRHASSPDGLTWRREGHVAIDYAGPGEHAFGRPCVRRDGDTWRMWYSVRGERYVIGVAESADGVRWTRRDDVVGIAPSESGWDADMIEYPCVVDVAGRRLMLYNGNDYGRSGIGWAELEA
jgi:hypothetical protein